MHDRSALFIHINAGVQDDLMSLENGPFIDVFPEGAPVVLNLIEKYERDHDVSVPRPEVLHVLRSFYSVLKVFQIKLVSYRDISM